MTGRPRSTGPKRTKTIKILITPELDARVTAAAKREGRSVSDWGQRLFDAATTPTVIVLPTPKRKRCKECNQRQRVHIDGSLETHMRMNGNESVLCKPKNKP